MILTVHLRSGRFHFLLKITARGENKMIKKKRRIFGVGFLGLLILLGAQTALAIEVPRITKEELKGMLGKPELVIIDVRYGKDWTGSKEKISGAIREDPQKDAKSWADQYGKDKTIVLYCA
jgi:hypothetical protein